MFDDFVKCLLPRFLSPTQLTVSAYKWNFTYQWRHTYSSVKQREEATVVVAEWILMDGVNKKHAV